MAKSSKTGKAGHGMLKETVATLGLLAIVAGAAAGAWVGFLLGGLGAAFLAGLAGAALGYGIVYLLTNVVRQNSGLFIGLLALGTIGLVAWGLHAVGKALGVGPP